MKANELMLGDWVEGLYPNGNRYPRPFRISAVDTYPKNRSPRIVTEGGYGFQEEHLNPVPLTPEILEKNGFNEERMQRMAVWRLDTFAVECDFSTWEFFWANGDVIINHVHELQHTLRLCGIDKEIVL